MIHNNHDFRSWKSEQITYFKNYLSNFKEGSEEHRIITDGIRELEKTL